MTAGTECVSVVAEKTTTNHRLYSAFGGTHQCDRQTDSELP